jgi:hypothetical protein
LLELLENQRKNRESIVQKTGSLFLDFQFGRDDRTRRVTPEVSRRLLRRREAQNAPRGRHSALALDCRRIARCCIPTRSLPRQPGLKAR